MNIKTLFEKLKSFKAYLQQSPQRWNMAVGFGLILYLILIARLIKTRPDHIFFALLIFSFAILGKRWGKLFLTDWAPWIFFWMAYDMMRGVADSFFGRINIVQPYEIENVLFGWLTSAEIPAFYFQTWQTLHEGEFIRTFLDVLCSNVYAVHFPAPLIVGWIVWQTLGERRNYYLFVYTLMTLNFMALATFMLYPAAPPWYVMNHGFEQPTGEFLDSAGALVNFDALIGQNWLRSLWNTFNSNKFAAIPSLHAAYPSVIAFFLWYRFRGRNWLWIIYPMIAWFSAVYLNHHYIIDLILGVGYAAAAFLISKHFLLPKVFDKIVDYNRTPKLVLKEQAAEKQKAKTP